MNVLFMGTSEFCIPILEILIKNNHNIVGIVTKPDNKFDKYLNNEKQYSIVKKFALNNNITLLQPNKLNSQFLNQINQMNIKLIIVASYGKIITKLILEKYRCINIHASLLPKYRGPSPIQYAILNGNKITGITIINMDENIDTGDILIQKQVVISDNDNAKTLMKKLSIVGGILLIYVLNNINTLSPKQQINDFSSYTNLLSKKNSYINWDLNAEEIINFVRAMYPWPIARTTIDNYVVKIYEIIKSKEIINNHLIKSGTIIFKNHLQGLCVKCKDSILEITNLQFPNSKIMSAKNYIIGNNISDECL